MSNKKYSFSKLEPLFNKINYTLLSDGCNIQSDKIYYMCDKQHKNTMTLKNFLKGRRCPNCAGNVKHTYNYISNKLKLEGYKLLSKEYINNKTKLDVECPSGHIYKVCFDKWRDGCRCPHCAGNACLNLRIIEERLRTFNYILLPNQIYKGNKVKLKMICDEGHFVEISPDNFNIGRRCSTCYNLNRSGENHWNWQGGVTRARYCIAWSDKEYKNSIKERDNYMCQNPYCFGIDKRLHVHHIDYTKTICGPDNLITLCGSCNSRANTDREWHQEWYRILMHKKYGYNYV